VSGGRVIVLASTSPRRRALLSSWGIKFLEIPPKVSERSSEKDPRKLVLLLSRRKARAVRGRAPKDALIIGSDLVVFFQGKIYGKPKGRKEAKKTLLSFSGKSQEIFCGVTVIDNSTGREVSGVARARIFFRKFGEREAEKYVRSGEYKGKAGGYAIQGEGKRLILRHSGELSAIIGLSKRLVFRGISSLQK